MEDALKSVALHVIATVISVLVLVLLFNIKTATAVKQPCSCQEH